MKKVLALMLSCLFLFCLTGCKDGETKKNGSGGVDIEYYAKLGQIPENEITLGTKPEKVKETIENRENESEDDHEHSGFNEIEGTNNVLIEEGSYDYYYKKANPEKGVGYMVSYAESFGFKTGDIISEVETALKSYDVKKEKASEKNAFFYFGDYSNAQILKIAFEKNSVLFLFENNALCATAIYRNDF